MVVNSARFNFDEVVSKILHDYGSEVTQEMFEGLDEASKKTVKKLKAESKSAVPGKYSRTGEYAKGWMRTLEKKRLSVFATIHGKTPATYAVAHLLEKGHALRNGGRANAYPHISTVNDWAQDEAIDCIVSRLEGRL